VSLHVLLGLGGLIDLPLGLLRTSVVFSNLCCSSRGDCLSASRRKQIVNTKRLILVNYAIAFRRLPPVLELLLIAKTLSSPSISGGVLLKLSPIGDNLREPRPTSASGSVLIGSVGLLGTCLWRNPNSDLFISLKMLSSSNCVNGNRE